MLIKEIPIVQIIEDFTGMEITKRSGLVCPICKHNNCFTVYVATNTYKCYRCESKGTSIDLVKDLYNISSITAINKINKYISGIPETSILPKTTTAPIKGLNSPDIELNNEFINYLSRQVQPKRGVKYLNRRGFGNSEIKEYNLCCIDMSIYSKVSTHLKKFTDFNFQRLQDSGLFNHKNNLIFGGERVIIPHFYKGNCINITARDITGITGTAKYLNLLNIKQYPFNLDSILRASKEVFILEGAFDAMSLELLTEIKELEGKGKKVHAIGLGGLHLPLDLVDLIHQQELNIVFMFDQDKAGQSKKSKESFKEFCMYAKSKGVKMRAELLEGNFKDANEMYVNYLK